MSSDPQQADPSLPAPTDEAGPGFWRRVFGGPTRPEVKDLPAAAPEGELAPARPRAEGKRNAPRAPKTDDEQQRRFARAAMLRRERLARAIGERVEQVLTDRIADGEQRLAAAQEGFADGIGEVGGLLRSIGKNLDHQADRGERVARILEGLPGASEREREALLEIARVVEREGAGTQGGLAAVKDLLAEVGRGLDQQGERAARTAAILEALPELARREAEALDGVSLTLDHHGRGIRDGVGALHEALTSIGRDLDLQGDRAERTARILETLPDAARREQESLDRVARVLEGQTGTQLQLAESVRDVPQVLALAREGQRAAEERLAALREVKHELELQRDQRAQLVEALRATSTRVEQRLVQLEAHLQQGSLQARADAEQVRLALEGVGARLAAQAREEAQREEARARRLEQGLVDVSRRLGESNVLQAAGLDGQRQTVVALQDAHTELMDVFQRAQSRALGEVQRIQDEAHRRAEHLAWRSRLALVGSAGLVALSVIFGVARPAPAPVVIAPATAEAERPAPTTLPAGFRRAPAGPPASDDVDRERRFAREAAKREEEEEGR
ncbi:MAG: hypothetical protein M9894_10890 [Planctomycetes bacterium]|nr:hypothetical protein [Planctomycetota bacterium]